MAHNIAVIGTGYVGLVTAIGLADFGNWVTGVDVDETIITRLGRGELTIFEHGLSEYLHKHLASGHVLFSTDVAGVIRAASIIIVTVGTPTKKDGHTDMTYIDQVADIIGDNLIGFKIIVIKSTVPVGTNRRIGRRIDERVRTKNRRPATDFAVVSNPEFLREGKALQDFFHPDRIVIGCENERARTWLADLYRTFNTIHVPFVWCNPETAELIKYASNAFLATKITFINQIANLAGAIGADINTISHSMGMDGRISPKFLHPGPGFGGSCFPKDTQALVSIGQQFGVEMSLVSEVIRANRRQTQRVVVSLKEMLGPLKGRRVTLLGITFKADTNDVRESPAIVICDQLLSEDAQVRVCDPQGIDNFRLLYTDRIDYFNDPFIALTDADACIIGTEWNDYRNLDLQRARQNMRNNVLLDTRNIINPETAKAMGFRYRGTGR